MSLSIAQSEIPDVSSPAPALRVAHNILNSSELDDTWRRYHYSRRHENPARMLADSMGGDLARMKEHPEALAFLAEIFRLEHGALRREDQNKDIIALAGQMAQVETQIREMAGDAPLPAVEDLPEDYQKLLSAIAHQTAQNKVQPIKALWQLTKDTAHHLWEEANEHPTSSLTLGAACAYIAYFMNKNLGTSSMYLDPMMTAVTTPPEALFDDSTPLDIETSLINLDYQSCHDHLSLMLQGAGVNKNVSDNIANAAQEHAPVLLAKHCAKIKTLLPDAQNWLNSGYDWFTARWDAVSGGPVRTLGDYLFTDGSVFKQAFDVAANNSAEFYYAANTFENMVLHTVMAAGAFAFSYKVGSLANEETKEVRGKVGDFFRRVAQNSPLTPLFGAAATYATHTYHDGWTHWMVWGGLAGMVAGETIHRYFRESTGHIHALKSTLSAQGALSGFSAPEGIFEAKKKTIGAKIIKITKTVAKTSAKAAAITTGLVLADVALNQGALTGHALGGGSVSVMVLGANVIEDSAAHIGIGTAFGTLGFLTGTVKKFTAYGLSGLRREADMLMMAANIDPFRFHWYEHQARKGMSKAFSIAAAPFRAVKRGVAKVCTYAFNKVAPPVANTFQWVRHNVSPLSYMFGLQAAHMTNNHDLPVMVASSVAGVAIGEVTLRTLKKTTQKAIDLYTTKREMA